MLNGRKRTAGFLATLCTAALTGTVLVAGPTSADPNLDQAEERVDTLFHKAEIASERYNDARIELREAKKRLRVLNSDLARQREKVEAIRDDVAKALVSQYQGKALSSAGQVMLADDPDAFLGQLATINGFNEQRATMLADFAVQAEQLKLRKAAAKRELARIADTKETLAKTKARIDERAEEAEELLSRLEERAADRVSRSRTTPQTLPDVAASGRAGAAVNYALGQVGDAYSYGAAGPNAFDCSGLTMAAWAQAGVSLPHSSSAQMSSGTPVSQSQLAPGDLVFYYSPVSHVGIYIGNGQIVHAANPSTGVQVTGLNSMPYSGAVRPG